MKGSELSKKEQKTPGRGFRERIPSSTTRVTNVGAIRGAPPPEAMMRFPLFQISPYFRKIFRTAYQLKNEQGLDHKENVHIDPRIKSPKHRTKSDPDS